ncbi:unnamed protein product [Toxocara canis]|uniref:Uncharacterized protein n=1 Tax=Toxocara canis TaxID=6265 RepID=A0A183V9V1_TOXCA|nr:unnamed protein product [Toxocara canis]
MTDRNLAIIKAQLAINHNDHQLSYEHFSSPALHNGPECEQARRYLPVIAGTQVDHLVEFEAEGLGQKHSSVDFSKDLGAFQACKDRSHEENDSRASSFIEGQLEATLNVSARARKRSFLATHQNTTEDMNESKATETEEKLVEATSHIRDSEQVVSRWLICRYRNRIGRNELVCCAKDKVRACPAVVRDGGTVSPRSSTIPAGDVPNRT